MSYQAPSPEDTIPVQEAIDITTNWRNFIQPIVGGDDYIRAFHIPIADITGLAEFHSATAVRAYLALGTAGDATTLKLALVPIDRAGNDIVQIPIPAQQSEVRTQSAVYDLTTPCPQACDLTSVLFTGE